MRQCRQCHQLVPETDKRTFCECTGLFDDVVINISGTRDGFGIRRSFYDPKTKQDIDTWRKWEKAGYRNPLEGKYTKNPEVKEMVKWHMKRGSKQPSKAVEMAEQR